MIFIRFTEKYLTHNFFEMSFFKSFRRSGVTHCFLLLAVISYYEYYSIEEALFNVGYMGGRDPYTIIFSVFVIVLLSFFAFYKDFKVCFSDRMARSYSYFMLVTLTISFLFFVTGLRHYTVTTPIKWISPLFVFWAVYSLTYKINDMQLMSKFALIMFVILIIGYYASFKFFQEGALYLDVQQQLISSYFPLFLLPLVVCIDNKLVRIAAIVAVVVVLLTSLKRGGVVAFGIAIFFYYLIKSITTDVARFKVRNLLFFAIGLALAIMGMDYLAQNSGLYIFERLSKLGEDEGSGRLEIYNNVIDMIRNSDFIGIILGHGFSAVGLDSLSHIGAHNDFLEVLYDYGIFGFILYLVLHIRLIKYSVRLVKTKSRFAAPMAMSYTLFLILSNVSQIIIHPFFLMLFSIVWASIMANRKHEIIGV